MSIAATYQIKDIEILTGIKAHTIRIWESRYKIVTPNRNNGNVRFYEESDLKKLLMISLLNRAGLKISEIAKFNIDQLQEKVNILYKTSSDNQSHIEALMISVNELDEFRFEKIFNQLLLHHGFEDTINNIIDPFFDKIEILWSTNSINSAQKNFVYNLINQKIINATGSENINETEENKRFAIFIPLGIYQNQRINFYNYYLKKKGFSVLFLGGNLPVNNLEKVNKIKPFSNILTILPLNFDCEENNEFVENVCNENKNKKIFIIDYKNIIINTEKYNNLLLIKNFNDFKNYLKLI